MDENIKIAVIPSGKERQIDFIFTALKKDNKLFFPIKKVTLEESFEGVEKFLSCFDQFQKYKDREIYHFNCFRNYMKINHFELYKTLDLDNPILDYMQDSYISLLLSLFQKLTEAGFISILNSDYVTIIYTPKSNITLVQKKNLDKLKNLMVDHKLLELVKCDGHKTETLKGNIEIVDVYLDSLHYRKEESKKR